VEWPSTARGLLIGAFENVLEIMIVVFIQALRGNPRRSLSISSPGYSQLTRGAALICVSPPQPGNLGIWTIAYWKVEAPAWLFERSMPTFETIFSSLHYDIKKGGVMKNSIYYKVASSSRFI
jgi:hypothetical protein